MMLTKPHYDDISLIAMRSGENVSEMASLDGMGLFPQDKTHRMISKDCEVGKWLMAEAKKASTDRFIEPEQLGENYYPDHIVVHQVRILSFRILEG